MITSSDLCALVCRLCIPAPCVDSLDGLCGQLTVKPVICVDRLLWTVHTDGSMSRTRPLPPSASAVSLFLVGGVATRGYRDRVYLYRATEYRFNRPVTTRWGERPTE